MYSIYIYIYIHLIGSRCDFYAYCIFSLVNTVVYCIPAGWLWGEHGFLYHLGVVDIAGSGGVHLIGGTSGKSQKLNHLKI